MKHADQVAAARTHIVRINVELRQLEDLLANAGGFRSGAFLDSLERCHQSAESAVVHAVQRAVPKMREG